MRGHVGLPRADGGSGKQCVHPPSGDDGFYFMVRYSVLESTTQKNTDKSPGVCQH